MKELLKYFRDVRFYVPALFLISLMVFLQSGLYKYFLQPRSYADNINHIVRVVGHSRLKPDILILGTSVAYQGINVPLLNRLPEMRGMVAQSAACEGAKLLTQQLLYRTLKKELPAVRVVLHVSEISFPWTARETIDEPNLSMIAQLPRRIVFPLLDEYDIRLSSQERMYLLFRVLTYRKDMRDAILDPLDRIKGIGRRWREEPSDYVYVNQYRYRLSSYPASNAEQCVQAARRKIPEKDEQGRRITDEHHRQAVRITCEMGRKERDPILTPGAAQWNRLFFRRLKLLHQEVRKDGREIITVFAPYSDLIKDMNADVRLRVWEKNLRKISPENPSRILDLRHALDDPRNGDLYYDTIHLNRYGAERLTRILARELARLPEIRALQVREN